MDGKNFDLYFNVLTRNMLGRYFYGGQYSVTLNGELCTN